MRVVFANDGTVWPVRDGTYYDSEPTRQNADRSGSSRILDGDQVAAAITAEGTFTAAVDYHDATALAQAGTNPVEVEDFGIITAGGSRRSARHRMPD